MGEPSWLQVHIQTEIQRLPHVAGNQPWFYPKCTARGHVSGNPAAPGARETIPGFPERAFQCPECFRKPEPSRLTHGSRYHRTLFAVRNLQTSGVHSQPEAGSTPL